MQAWEGECCQPVTAFLTLLKQSVLIFVLQPLCSRILSVALVNSSCKRMLSQEGLCGPLHMFTPAPVNVKKFPRCGSYLRYRCIYMYMSYSYIFWVVQTVKCLLAMQETWVQSLGWEDPLEKEMATYSSTLAWKIPWIEKPGKLQSLGSQRVGHN